MPRDGSGNYTLPAGINPVVSGTIIASTWANPTLEDVAVALQDSLSRSGQGGMLVPLLFADGQETLPSIAFVSEPGSGLSKEIAQTIIMSIAANPTTRWLDATGQPPGGQSPFQIWDGLAWGNAVSIGATGLQIPNDVPIQWRNAADDAYINGLVMNASDQFTVGNVLRLLSSGQVRAISSTAAAPSFQAMSNDNIVEPTMAFVNSTGNSRAGLHAFPKGSATLWDMELKAGNFQTVMKLDSNLDVTVPSGDLRVGDDPAFTNQRMVISDSSATTRLRINSNAVSGVSSGLEIYTRGVFKGAMLTQDSGDRLDLYGAFLAAPTLSLSADQSATFNGNLLIGGDTTAQFLLVERTGGNAARVSLEVSGNTAAINMSSLGNAIQGILASNATMQFRQGGATVMTLDGVGDLTVNRLAGTGTRPVSVTSGGKFVA